MKDVAGSGGVSAVRTKVENEIVEDVQAGMRFFPLGSSDKIICYTAVRGGI